MSNTGLVEHKFEFAPTPSVAFDDGVAKEIAAAIQESDGGRYNHAHASQFVVALVEVEGFSEPFSRVNSDYEEYDGDYAERIVLPGEIVLGAHDPNAIFAREYQRALDRREYSNRMNIKGSMGFAATMAAIPAGVVAGALSTEGLTAEETVIAAGAGAFGLVVTGAGYHMPRNIYRRILTNPDSFLSEVHAEKAADLAKTLDLGSVISPA